MIRLVKIISAEIGTQGKRAVKFLGMGKDDVQTAQATAPFGVDSNPIADLVGVYAKTGEMGKTVLLGYLNRDQLAEKGELRLYSLKADGSVSPKTYLHFKNDETIEFGGNADFMVRYSALETAFNQLKAEFNAHVHSSNGTPPVTPSTADISGAKIEEIKTL